MEQSAINGGSQIFPSLPAGYATRSVAGGADVTLASNEGASDIIELTGALTANIVVTIPTPIIPQIVGTTTPNFQLAPSWLKLVRNSTVGGFSITIIGPGGIGVVLPPGSVQWLYSRDGINVQPGSSASSVFPSPAQSQPTWFIDPQNVTGLASDANTGLTALTPLLHYAEIIRRWGTTAPMLLQTTSFTWLSSDLTLTDPVFLEPGGQPITNPSGFSYAANFNGMIVQVASGTLSGVVQRDRATNVKLQGVISGVAPASVIDHLVHDTTNDSWFWVRADLGGGVCEFSQPFERTGADIGNTVPAEKNTVANLDAVIVYSVPQINLYAANASLIAQLTNLRLPNFVTYDAPDGTNLFQCSIFGGVGTNGASVSLANCIASTGGEGPFVYAGAIQWIGGYTPSAVNFLGQGTIFFDGDVIVGGVGGEVSLAGNAQFGFVCVDQPTLNIPDALSGDSGAPFGNGLFGFSFYGVGALYGACALALHTGGNHVYAAGAFPGTATAIFLQLGGFTIDSSGTASSYDNATGVWNPAIPITPANLDAPVGPAGFGGVAYGVRGTHLAKAA